MPTLWKSANITPIHKGDERELVENYRSVSLLPIPAKCLEGLVHSVLPSTIMFHIIYPNGSMVSLREDLVKHS